MSQTMSWLELWTSVSMRLMEAEMGKPGSLLPFPDSKMKEAPVATWTSDVAGTGLCHTRPLTMSERKRARQIARRWRMWEPVLLHELRVLDRPVAAELPKLRALHNMIMSRLLDAGVTMERISRAREVRLDDPRISEELRTAELARGPGRPWKKQVSDAQRAD